MATRKLEIKIDGKKLFLFVDSQPLQVKWDLSVVSKAIESGKLYPQLKDQLIKLLKSRLEDSSMKLSVEEITSFVKMIREEVGL